jgi:hypothetical protein
MRLELLAVIGATFSGSTWSPNWHMKQIHEKYKEITPNINIINLLDQAVPEANCF